MPNPQTHAGWTDPQNDSEIDQEFIRRWKEALERSKSKLADEDRNVVESLKTPEAILLDLEDLQRRQNHGWLRQMSTQLSPFMKSLQAFSTCFVIAMLPHSVETSLAWGVFSLVLRLGYMSEQRAQKIVEILNSLRRVLLKVNRFASGQLAKEEEVKEALVDIYVKLVEFWVKLVKELRSDPSGLKSSIWKDITGSLNQTLVEIETSYDAMRELADYHQSFRMEEVGQTLPVSNVAFPMFLLPIPENPHFFGRDAILKRMQDHLDPVTRGRKLRCFTVYGLGGIGKTQVAAAYAYKHRQANDDRSYDAVFWIASEDKAAMRRSFSNMALSLKVPGISESSNPQAVSDAVRNWLKQTDKRWLVIYDNAERWNDIMPDYWPPSGSVGSVIITSRDFTLAKSPASDDEELQALSRDDSRNFVSSLLKDWDSDSEDEREALEELLVQLDGLPLALHQISSLITAGGSSIQDFLDMYKEHADELLEDQDDEHNPYYSHSLETVWSLACQSISKSPDLNFILGIICLLSPDGIPEKLFQVPKATKVPSDPGVCSNAIKLRKRLISLRSKGMISLSKGFIRIHRLAQSAFLKYVQGDAQNNIFCAAAVLVNGAFPKQHLGDPLYEQWATCSLYLPHVQSLAKHWDSEREQGRVVDMSGEFIELLSHASWYLHEIQDYDNAMKLVDIGLDAAGDNHELLVAHLLNTKGVVQSQKYDYSAAQDTLKKSLDIRKRLYGEGHQETAGIRQNLASLTAARGFYVEAHNLYEAAEKSTTEHSFDEKRLAACRYAANYGRCFTAEGKFDEAHESLTKSRDILARGADNPIYRRAIEYCFGNLELAQGNLDQAKRNFLECLNGYNEDIKSKNRPMTYGCYHKLAMIAIEQDDSVAAAGEIKKAIDVAEISNAQGCVGRLLLLKKAFLEKYPSQTDQFEPIAEVELRIQATCDNLEAIAGVDFEGSKPRDPSKVFDLFIPWQAR